MVVYIIILQLLAKGEESYIMFLNSITQLGTVERG